MIPIGEFAKLCGVTVKTLHHYDAVGLLKPAHVDQTNGFRYYCSQQLSIAHQILVLKASAFSLKEIKKHLAMAATSKELTALMMEKLNQMEQDILHQQQQAQHLRKQIFRMQNGGLAMNPVVVVKNVEPILVASLREVIHDYSEMPSMWQHLNDAIDAEGIKKAVPCMTLYHNGWDTKTGMDISVIEPVTKAFIPRRHEDANVSHYAIEVVELPGVHRMASIVHQGDFDTIAQTYHILEQWLQDHQEQLNGPVREIYHEGEWSTDDPKHYVTEIQYPLL